MSIHFHKLEINKIRKETADCVSVSFAIPETLRDLFRYRQGQSLTMRLFSDDEEIRRTYSLCSCPLDDEWKVAIKKVPGGIFSTFANETLREGDVLEVMPPIGRFYTDLDPTQQKQYLAFAAGSGITPVLSIIRTTLRIEPHSSFTLVYGNKTRSSIIFLEELQGLKNRYMERFHLINILSREKTDAPLFSGRINADKVAELASVIDYSAMDEVFLCGPEEMIFTLRDQLPARGIDPKKIHFELFTTPGTETRKSATTRTTPDQGPKYMVSIKLDGRSFDLELSRDDDTSILDAALKKGADLPFACKGGVCCTCKARLVSGEVTMDVHWGLEDEEVQEGYILTCQSHPVSDKVVVDFDIK